MIVTFVLGLGVLWGRSEDGLIARARYGLPVDRTMLARSISKTVRTTILDFGIPVGAQVIKTNDSRDPRVPLARWTVYLPGRSSTLQLNARLTETQNDRRTNDDLEISPGIDQQRHSRHRRFVTKPEQ